MSTRCFPLPSQEHLNSDIYTKNVVAKGLAGGPGAAVGMIVFSTKIAEPNNLATKVSLQSTCRQR